jgi:hypothetical protein
MNMIRREYCYSVSKSICERYSHSLNRRRSTKPSGLF